MSVRTTEICRGLCPLLMSRQRWYCNYKLRYTLSRRGLTSGFQYTYRFSTGRLRCIMNFFTIVSFGGTIELCLVHYYNDVIEVFRLDRLDCIGLDIHTVYAEKCN